MARLSVKAKVVAPVDVELDKNQDWLDDVSTSLLNVSKQDTGESIGKRISDRVKGFIERLKTSRARSEFNYRQLLADDGV